MPNVWYNLLTISFMTCQYAIKLEEKIVYCFLFLFQYKNVKLRLKFREYQLKKCIKVIMVLNEQLFLLFSCVKFYFHVEKILITFAALTLGARKLIYQIYTVGY
jgi:hypothetical protein